MILLIACAMSRLIPFFEPFQNENETRKGLNTFVELSSVALVLPAFIRIDSSAIGNDAYGFFMFFQPYLLFAAGFRMIFSNKNASERRYFVLTLPVYLLFPHCDFNRPHPSYGEYLYRSLPRLCSSMILGAGC